MELRSPIVKLSQPRRRRLNPLAAGKLHALRILGILANKGTSSKVTRRLFFSFHPFNLHLFRFGAKIFPPMGRPEPRHPPPPPPPIPPRRRYEILPLLRGLGSYSRIL